MGSAAGKASDYDAGKQALACQSVLGKKLWLPRAVYSAVPFFYLVCAICALLTTLYIADWFWLVPHYLLISFACVHMAILVFRPRRKRDPEPPTSP